MADTKQFWQMQIHPGNKWWKKEKEALEKGFIGLGDWKEKSKNKQQNDFEYGMKEGHVVLIHRGKTIIALVEITGPYEYSKTTDDLLWFVRFRRIKVLDWYKDTYNYRCLYQGTLKKCVDMSKPTNRAVLDWYKMVQQRRSQMMDTLNALLRRSYNLILTGAPGTGKTYLARQLAQKLIFGENWTLEREVDFKPDEKAEFERRFRFVQFHPSYDYTDFVEGLRPKSKSDESGNIGFERKDGVFMEFCGEARAACKHRENGEYDETNSPKFVFIIDEINRGEISKILGELFFSIDPGYRGIAGKVLTQYANMKAGSDDEKKFYVPENVYIIGTMNDIDRSVESFDFAMRRRFVWEEIKAWDTKDGKNVVPMLDSLDEIKPGLAEAAVKHLVALNRAIWDEEGGEGKGTGIDGLNPSYHIGGAYFLKLKGYDGNFDERFADLWRYHLEPLLREYLRGMPEEKKKLDTLKKAYDAANN